MLKSNYISSALNKVVYFTLLGVGVYFMYQGQVIQRYLARKFDFSEYTEPVSELPTLCTFTVPYQTMKFGQDFNISFGAVGSPLHKNLSIGINRIPDPYSDNSLLVDFEQLYGMNIFKITPLNVSPPLTNILDYNLSYIFENSTILEKKIKEVGIYLSTENNSIAATGQFRDGVTEELHFKIGLAVHINEISPEKIVLDPALQDCRPKPYIEMLFDKISKEIMTCAKPCQPFSYGKHLNKVLGELPFCQNSLELKCFNNLSKTYDKLSLKTPCTTLQYMYQHVSTKYEENDNSDVPSNIARFIVLTSSMQSVKVREQYVIYDSVAMVSAIGGTLGLCIGLSFSDCFNALFRIIEAGIKNFNRNESDIGVEILFEPEDKINTLVRRQQKFEERMEAIVKELKFNQEALKEKLE